MKTIGKSKVGKRFGRTILYFILGVAYLNANSVVCFSNEEASEKDDYNFSWLESDKPIYVLQNRRYKKANRVMLSALGGVGISNSYRNTYSGDFRAGYYFSEQFGLEGLYQTFFNQDNNTYKNLTRAAPNTLPKIREMRQIFGGVVHWVPWYAKLNMFNQIIYFDWYLQAGIGNVGAALDTRASSSLAATYSNENFVGYLIGTGHHYYLSNHFSLRMDFLGAIYQAPSFGDVGDKTFYSNYTFSLGMGFRL